MKMWIVFVWQDKWSRRAFASYLTFDNLEFNVEDAENQLRFLTLAYLVQTEAYKDETDLRANLSSGYNRFVRPNTTTNITLYYNIRALKDLDIKEQETTITGWLTSLWSDPRFVWDSSTNDIDQLEISWGWRPEFVIANSADGDNNVGMKNDHTRLRIYSSGSVRWNVVLVTTTTCDVDISKFPFDTQTCQIEIIFWGFTAEELQLTNMFPVVQTRAYMENAEWIFDSSSTSIYTIPLCCPESETPMWIASFAFSRRRPFYVMNLIFPTVLLSVCMIWAFMLPTESGERLGYSLTVLLAYTMQLSITAQLMPTTSKQVPLIAKYLLVVLVLCTLVTCNVAMHVKLFYLEYPAYGWLQRVYKKVYPLIFLKCCSKKKKHDTDTKVEVLNIDRDKTNISFQKKAFDDDKDSVKETDQEEVTWSMISVLLDRIFFYLYVIAISTVNGVFLNSIS